jgi:hypothetical protein
LPLNIIKGPAARIVKNCGFPLLPDEPWIMIANEDRLKNIKEKAAAVVAMGLIVSGANN